MREALALALQDYHRTRKEFLRLCDLHRRASYDEQAILGPQVDAALDTWAAAQGRYEQCLAALNGIQLRRYTSPTQKRPHF